MYATDRRKDEAPVVRYYGRTWNFIKRKHKHNEHDGLKINGVEAKCWHLYEVLYNAVFWCYSAARSLNIAPPLYKTRDEIIWCECLFTDTADAWQSERRRIRTFVLLKSPCLGMSIKRDVLCTTSLTLDWLDQLHCHKLNRHPSPRSTM